MCLVDFLFKKRNLDKKKYAIYDIQLYLHIYTQVMFMHY